MLFVGTARPEFTPPWPARSNLTDAAARPDSRSARRARWSRAVGGAELPAEVVDALVARADGVPLYVEELTKAVMEPGATR